jgi:hypothetical protein
MEQSHILNLLIAGSDSTVPLTAGAAYISSYADLDDGAFSVCNDQNMVVDATTVLTDDRVSQYGIRLVGRYGTKLVYSDLIEQADIITAKGIETSAAAEQVTYIGYTGSANSIAVINDNVYKLNIQVEQIGRTGRGNPYPIDIMYRSDAVATQTSVAFGIMGNLVPTLAKEAEKPIVARLINSCALVNNDRFTSTVTAVQGSKYLTFSANFATTSGLTMAVGDLIRIGDASDDVTAAVALGSTVYKVITLVSATVVEIDRPFTGAGGVATASTDASLIPIATVGNYGIRLDGVAPTWVLGKRPWNKNIFKVGLTDFGSTIVTESTRAALGKGLENQIRDLEWFTQGEGGAKYRGDFISQGYTSRVEASGTYKQISLTWASKSRTESIGGAGHNPKQLIIALHSTADNNDANDIIIDVLEAYTGVELLASY